MSIHLTQKRKKMPKPHEMHEVVRDCTPEEKDALLVFLIGYFLASHGAKQMMLTEELVDRSVFTARLPAYNTGMRSYTLKAF